MLAISIGALSPTYISHLNEIAPTFRPFFSLSPWIVHAFSHTGYQHPYSQLSIFLLQTLNQCIYESRKIDFKITEPDYCDTVCLYLLCTMITNRGTRILEIKIVPFISFVSIKKDSVGMERMKFKTTTTTSDTSKIIHLKSAYI